MLSSFAGLFAILVAVPGFFIPLHVIAGTYRVLTDEERVIGERIIAGGTIVAMLGIIRIAMFAAWEVYTRLGTLHALEQRP